MRARARASFNIGTVVTVQRALQINNKTVDSTGKTRRHRSQRRSPASQKFLKLESASDSGVMYGVECSIVYDIELNYRYIVWSY
jgi:hypothetical protein